MAVSFVFNVTAGGESEFYEGERCWDKSSAVDVGAWRRAYKRKAFEHYLRAAEQGHVKAAWIVSCAYRNDAGWGQYKNIVPENEVEAGKWTRKAAEGGIANAQDELGDYYYGGSHGFEKNITEAVKWWRKAAVQGNSYAQVSLGNCYHKGEGVCANDRVAVWWYSKAAENGYYEYHVKPDLMKTVTPQSQEVAVRGYQADAERGDADAQNNLAVCYALGDGIEKNLAEAVKWYRDSAEQGNKYAQSNLAFCYLDGRGIEKDEEEAAWWFSKSAGQGYKTAQLELDKLRSRGIKPGHTKTIERAIKKAEQGDVEALKKLAFTYEESDLTEAVKWWRKAAEQGDVDAQNSLGYFYYEGKGVEKDLTRAFKWYSKAAEQGHAKAQNNLGEMYRDGEGTEKDLDMAKKWFTKAANQGHKEAQKNLRGLEE
ncbi:MAG: sel1 repeat family protein [Verrucomicrobia bacterium]|nr:sel1 repeat family protein [Verrucomicrobiota bacterium]